MLCFFFKQKTAYEMRISDWSSNVCSSDLTCDNCSRLLTRLSDSSDDDSTETETGTFCRFCSRFCAVTTISSPIAASPAAVPPGADWLSCAWAPTETDRSEEHTSELQSLMRISYAVFCLKKKNIT